MKVFLDIDGVMVHANPHKRVEMEEDGFYKFKSEAVSAINTIKKAEIVLSTSHRHRFSKNKWRQLFEHRGINFTEISIIETNTCIYSSRKEEIESWIEVNHIEYDNLIIIDDDKSLNGLKKELKERLVLTSSYVGLNDDQDIRRVLNQPIVVRGKK